jgi:hypothetical protein
MHIYQPCCSDPKEMILQNILIAPLTVFFHCGLVAMLKGCYFLSTG